MVRLGYNLNLQSVTYNRGGKAFNLNQCTAVSIYLNVRCSKS